MCLSGIYVLCMRRALGGEKRALDLLQRGLQAVVSHLMYVLRTQPGSYVRVARTFNNIAIYLASSLKLSSEDF